MILIYTKDKSGGIMSSQNAGLFRRLASAALALAIVAVAVQYGLRSLSSADLRRVLLAAELGYLAWALPFVAMSYAARGLRWHFLFPNAVRAAGLRHSTGILLIGFLLNNLLPARGGELVRVVLMGRHNKVPASGTLATLFAERVFDGFALGVVALLSFSTLASSDVRWVQRVSLLFAVLFVGLLATALGHGVAARVVERIARRFPGRLSRNAGRALISALGYLGTLASLSALARACVLTLAVWTFEAVSYALIALAFGVQLDLARVGGFLSAVNFASLAPTPGGVGAVELAGTAVLVAGGLARETAFVLVSTQHVMQYAFCLLAGGFYAGRLGFTWGSKVVAPFRALCDLESLLPEESRIAREVLALEADRGPQLSVVVPAYNEAERVLPTLLAMLEYLPQRYQRFEIIVVDDGSTDATADVVHQLGLRVDGIRLVCLPKNLGKGAAVRAGMRSASGALMLFADADGATPITELDRLVRAIEDGADVAIASRTPIGRTFASLVNAWVVPGIADTRCGFKLFRRAAAKRIFDLQQLDGVAFDVELLKLANVLEYRTSEVAVSAAQTGIPSDTLRVHWDVLRVPYLRSVARATGSLLDGGVVRS
jgi:dolichyl-phosphate beta-glucosyltransferase